MNFAGTDMYITLICGESEIKENGKSDKVSAIHFFIRKGSSDMPDTKIGYEFCEDYYHQSWGYGEEGSLNYSYLKPGDCVVLSRSTGSNWIMNIFANGKKEVREISSDDRDFRNLFTKQRK